MQARHLSWMLAGALVLTGCATEPVEDIQAAESALEDARTAEAQAYAPDAWEAANDARARLDAELQAQKDRFGLLRSYDNAKNLAAEVKQAAQSASETAMQAKQQARDEATTLMAQAREEYARAQQALDRAPTGKGTQADLAALRADTSGIEPTLAEMQQAFDAQDYLTAKARATAAIEASQRVIQQIEGAKAQAGSV